eukprot:545148_1
MADAEEPKQEEPEQEEPEQEEPKQEEAQQEEPKKEEPEQEEPKKEAEQKEEAPKEEPKQEEPAQEEVQQEEPKKEEPKQEEPKQEEPKEEEPKQEEPKKEEAEQEEPKKEEESKPKSDDDTAKKEEKTDDKAVKSDNKKEEKKEEKEEDVGPPPDWELFYWQGFGGRATVIRLSFELAQIKWSEALKGKNAKTDASISKVKGADIDGFPNFAYPIVKHKENIISQTPAICMYILGQTEYKIENELERIYALQIVLTVWDAFTEWTGKINKTIGFGGWITSRIGSYLSVLENQLKRNNEGKGWYFGDKASVADVFVADFMRRYKYAKPDHYKSSPFNLLKEHTKRFEEIEQIQKYIASDGYKSVIGKKFLGL